MALELSGGRGNIIALHLTQSVQITTATTTADAAQALVPCDGTIVGIVPVAGIIAGTTEFTDIDLDLENGTTDLFAAPHPVVDSSAITLTQPSVSTAALKRVSAGDVLHLDIVTTGGSSPTADGFGLIVYIAVD